MSLKTIGNTTSNLKYNPNPTRFPPPTSSSADERDSEMEKYIRKKYELGAFKQGSSSGRGNGSAVLEPTSLNRYKQAQGNGHPKPRIHDLHQGGRDLGPWDRSQENSRNPELNDLVIRTERKKSQEERELPPLPISASSTGARERPRPIPSSSTTAIPALSASAQPPQRSQTLPQQQQQQASSLVDFSELSSNSTLPLQTLAPPLSYLSPNSAPSGYGSYLTPTPMSAPATQAFSPNQQQQIAGTSINMGHNTGGVNGSYFTGHSQSPMQSPPNTYMNQQQQQQSSYNPFLQQQQQQQNGLIPQQGMTPGFHNSNPFFNTNSTSQNPTPNSNMHQAQLAVRQAMMGPQSQIFPNMNQNQGWGNNQQSQFQPQPQQQNMGWSNGAGSGYNFAQGR